MLHQHRWKRCLQSCLLRVKRNITAGPSKSGVVLKDLTGMSANISVSMAKGMGVEGSRASDCEGLSKAIDAGLRSKGPYLIEVAL